mmetsp:Transcript_31704/g.79004  ORF Transcript_31704/g.79004 Transcript_31704/m.79004 type:complete len:213 (-) Transcript_31704:2-640(-)
MCGVFDALVVHTPQRARCLVLVRAHRLLAGGEVARVRARLQRVPWVGDTFTVLGPAGAVVVLILALRLAHPAGDGAVQVHEARVVLALPLLRPMVAVVVQIGAFGGAEPARGGALGVHVIRRGGALALLRPRRARLVPVGANDRTNPTAVWAECLDVGGVAAGAFAVLGPRGARGVLVVAEAEGGGGSAHGEEEEGEGGERGHDVDVAISVA